MSHDGIRLLARVLGTAGRYIVMVVMYPGESGRHGLVVGNSRQAGHGWRLESGWVPWMHRVWLEW